MSLPLQRVDLRVPKTSLGLPPVRREPVSLYIYSPSCLYAATGRNLMLTISFRGFENFRNVEVGGRDHVSPQLSYRNGTIESPGTTGTGGVDMG
jgi:hypothetical protein